jgi:hypothetical protein
MARSALARSRGWRRSRSATSGISGQVPSSAAAAAAAPRRVSGGGATSRTVAPISSGAAAPGSRSRTRSPACSGSASRNVRRAKAAIAADAGPAAGADGAGSKRIRATVRAEPMCRVSWAGRRTSDPAGRRRRTSTVLVMVQRAGSTRAMPRAGTPAGTPRRLSATRATPLAWVTGSPRDSMPRMLTGRIAAESRSS